MYGLFNHSGKNHIDLIREISYFLISVKIMGRHSQVVRQRSAKPLFFGSNPNGASKKKLRYRRNLSIFYVLAIIYGYSDIDFLEL